MGTILEPDITPTNKRSYTKITFKPDLERFGMTNLDEDIIALMTKRVYDIAGCNPTVKVSLNGERISVKSFAKYCELYLKVRTQIPLLLFFFFFWVHRCNPRVRTPRSPRSTSA